MKKIAAGLIFILIVVEIISWKAYKSSQEVSETKSTPGAILKNEELQGEETGRGFSEGEDGGSDADFSEDDIVYPRVTMEEKNGRVERTIHMGVRQYVWDPNELRVKEGELVRLVIHNADVMHGIAIPDFGVNEDIPEEGAVVEFIAGKRGTFEFFCSVWCGERHMEMRGRIIVE